MQMALRVVSAAPRCLDPGSRHRPRLRTTRVHLQQRPLADEQLDRLAHVGGNGGL